MPKYEAILGKPWMDRWNPIIDWKRNRLVWTMGARKIVVQGVKDPQGQEMISSLFQKNLSIEMISAQRMRRLAKKELVYLAVIRTTNDIGNANTENDSRNEEPRK